MEEEGLLTRRGTVGRSLEEREGGEQSKRVGRER